MTKNKLYPQLRKLKGKKELSAFGKYLAKNYGKHTTAIALFRYIRDFYPHYDDKKLDTEVIFQALKEQKDLERNISKTTILNASSDLNLWLKEFLIRQKASRESLEGNSLWLEILLERGLQSEGIKQLRTLREQMEDVEEKGVQLYFKQLFASYLDYYKIPKNTSTETYQTLEKCWSDLNTLEALLRLRLACEMRSREKLEQVQTTIEDAPASPIPATGYAPSFLAANPLIHSYVETYQLIIATDKLKGLQHFEKALELVTLHAKSFPLDEKYAILAYLQNYSIDQIRNENLDFYRKAHELDVLSLEQGVYTLTGLMAEGQYINIVSFACHAKEFEWAEQFIENYIAKIKESERDKVLSIARATLAFWQKKYQEALDILSTYTSDPGISDINFTLRSKPFFLACHYELSLETDDDFIISNCNAFERLIKRQKKLKGLAISGILNFSQVLKKMARKNAPKELILKEINTKKPLALKDWLLEKVADYRQ